MRAQRAKVLLSVANRQFGVLRYADLLRAGMDRGDIARWLACGRLTRLHRGIYVLGDTALRPEGR
jgi:hypothetical protein